MGKFREIAKGKGRRKEPSGKVICRDDRPTPWERSDTPQNILKNLPKNPTLFKKVKIFREISKMIKNNHLPTQIIMGKFREIAKGKGRRKKPSGKVICRESRPRSLNPEKVKGCGKEAMLPERTYRYIFAEIIIIREWRQLFSIKSFQQCSLFSSALCLLIFFKGNIINLLTSTIPLKCSRDATSCFPLKCSRDATSYFPLKCSHDATSCFPLKCSRDAATSCFPLMGKDIKRGEVRRQCC